MFSSVKNTTCPFITSIKITIFKFYYEQKQPIEKESSVAIKQSFTAEGKTVQVYTTAKNTDLKLTATGSQTFKDASQPLETEIAIFVNPNKTF